MNKNTNTAITYEMIETSKLKLDDYQRNIDVTFAKKIASDYKPSNVGLIDVSLRNGIFHVVDGQHRVYAAILLGVEKLMCHISHGLSYEDEAKRFIQLNRIRKGVLAYDCFKASLEAKEEKEMVINSCMEKYGFRPSKGTRTNNIQALRKVETIYLKHGLKTLDTVFYILRNVWDGQKSCMNGDLMLGIAEFLKQYNNQIDARLLVTKLKRVEPLKILSVAKSDTTNKMLSLRISNVLINHYNWRLKTKIS